ncbi:hypothetical protein [Bradyrhizobium sp. Ai1a-2]|uniref:hypothetical protein n=1 Tax=Bradyrhizobium sp. Ai1a-2 TaxID=196490 RepID=UPI0006874891|nr:hypothetical protein [Bradyrhizobium sp. Ai1a-2]
MRFEFEPAPALESLALYSCGEMRLAHWYRCASAHYIEPVIKHSYTVPANDEARHARVYWDYMRKAIARGGKDAFRAFSKIGVHYDQCLPESCDASDKSTSTRISIPTTPSMGDYPIQLGWKSSSTKISESTGWENKVEGAILMNLSWAFGETFGSSHNLRRFSKKLKSTEMNAGL